MLFQLKRLAGFALGFVLFYGPLSLFQRAIGYLLTGRDGAYTIHSLCLRIPIEHILDGRILSFAPVSVIGTLLLLVTAAVFGPVFCGRLCPAGAVTEYLSKLMPSRYQISWSNNLPLIYLRYGMLAGYGLIPFTGGVIACSYCNFLLFDLFSNFYLQGYFISLSSSLLLTMVMWLVVLGLFTKGGRGYCNLLCPVGALQSFIYSGAGRLLPNYKMVINKDRCIGCSSCSHSCPMEAITMEQQEQGLRPHLSIHHCIICGQCSHTCPTEAIAYRRHL